MALEIKHLYHPFEKDFFGAFSNHNTSDKNLTGILVEDVDLYYQPVQIPVIGVIFLIIRISLMVIGEIIQFKVLALLKREDSLVNEVAKLYIITLMISDPIVVVLMSSTDFIHPMNEVVGQWFCSLLWFSGYLMFFIIAFHSLIVAIMRYFFIVKEDLVKSFGKDRAKKLFLFLSFFIPFFVITWTGIEPAVELDAMSFYNKCYGVDHKVFLIKTSMLNIDKFCQVYNESSSLDNILAVFMYISCTTRTIIMIVMGFNFAEIILYYKILSHIYR